MANRMRHIGKSLFDFGPLAKEYDRWYETPAGQAHDPVQKEDVKRLLRPGQTGERLLDVGCGTGHWSSFFTTMGYQVTGIDIAPEMIDVARAAVPECSFQIADAFDLPFEDGAFDVVASMALLEFISDPAAVVREMARCRKSGGSLLIGTLNRLAPLNQHRLSKGKEPYASAHLLSPDELQRLLASWGGVRMVASSPRQRKGRSFLPARIASRLPMFRGRLHGPPMNVQAEVSLYPLQTQEIGEAIDSFVNDLERTGLTVRKGNMSTTLSGDGDAVFAALASAFTAVADGGRVVLVMKVSNACPSDGVAERMNTNSG